MKWKVGLSPNLHCGEQKFVNIENGDCAVWTENLLRNSGTLKAGWAKRYWKSSHIVNIENRDWAVWTENLLRNSGKAEWAKRYWKSSYINGMSCFAVFIGLQHSTFICTKQGMWEIILLSNKPPKQIVVIFNLLSMLLEFLSYPSFSIIRVPLKNWRIMLLNWCSIDFGKHC